VSWELRIGNCKGITEIILDYGDKWLGARVASICHPRASGDQIKIYFHFYEIPAFAGMTFWIKGDTSLGRFFPRAKRIDKEN
jgi:hypothetical protein